MKARQDDIAPEHQDTFKWIFHDNVHFEEDEDHKSGSDSDQIPRPEYNFLQWLEHGMGTYWISGKAGSGKSVLMRYLLESPSTKKALLSWTNGGEISTPAFFLWRGPDASVLQKSMKGMLRALLYQLLELRPELISTIVPNGPMLEWTEERLRSCFSKLLNHTPVSKGICIVIDGLDEMEGELDVLVDVLKQCCLKSNVKLCMSSRPCVVFRTAFSESPQLELHNVTRNDIRHYVTDKLSLCAKDYETEGTGLTEAQVWNLRDQIVHNADGVFVWVKLALASVREGLRNCDEYETICERLRILPSELNELYCHMISAIPQVYRAEAAQYMRLMIAANGTMKLLSLGFAIDSVHHRPYLSDPLSSWSWKQTIRYYKTAQIRLLARCMGFLELEDGLSNRYFDNHRVGDPQESSSCIELQQDMDKTKVRFVHRTAWDFLCRSPHPINEMELGSPSEPRSYAALAATEIRRIQLLPWMGSRARNVGCLLKEPRDALDWLELAECHPGEMHISLLLELNTVMQELTRNVVIRHEGRGITLWSAFLQAEVGPEGHSYRSDYGMVISLTGMCCSWRLQYSLECLLKSDISGHEATELLACLLCREFGPYAHTQSQQLTALRACRSSRELVQSNSQTVRNEMAQLLFDHGADPNARTALAYLSWQAKSSQSGPKESAWFRIMIKFLEVIERYRFWHSETRGDPWTESFVDLIRRFVIAGADVNQSIVFREGLDCRWPPVGTGIEGRSYGTRRVQV